jgi:hypothetical protein
MAPSYCPWNGIKAVGSGSESVTRCARVVAEKEGEGEERKGEGGGGGQLELPREAAGEPHSIPQAACTSAMGG